MLVSISFGISICHSVVSADRVPVIMVFWSCITSILSLVIVAVQPASHNCPTESRLCVVISGTICASVAAGDSVGMSKCPSNSDVIVLPSGIVIRIGVRDLVMLMRLFCGVAKCVVQPVSIIVGLLLVVGGPMSIVLNAFFIFLSL